MVRFAHRHMRRSLQRTPRIRLETFALFLVMAGVLTSFEFAVFHIQSSWAEAGRSFWQPETVFDAHIPLSPIWIWPYWLYFAFLGVTVWLVRDRRELLELAVGITTVHMLGFAFFLLFPSEMPRQALPCDPGGLTCGLVGAMYLLDPGYGVFPSLHVAASAFLAMFAFRNRSPLRWPVAVSVVLIVLSTVFVKQHYVIDLPAGIALGLIGGRIGIAWGSRLAEARSTGVFGLGAGGDNDGIAASG